MSVQKRFWKANPAAMAAVALKGKYEGAADLGAHVDADTWLTPKWILDSLGTFDLDPCAAEVRPEWTGAKRRFTVAEDGLTQPWKGRVFMNPPFSNTAEWLERHAAHGSGISLVPATVESIVWREQVWAKAKALYILHGRVRFCNPDGSTTTGRPLRGIALIGWAQSDVDALRQAAFAGIFLDSWSAR